MRKTGFYRVSFETHDNGNRTYYRIMIRADSAKQAEKMARLEAMKNNKIVYNVFAQFETA